MAARHFARTVSLLGTAAALQPVSRRTAGQAGAAALGIGARQLSANAADFSKTPSGLQRERGADATVVRSRGADVERR